MNNIKVDNAQDAELWRLAQAKELLLRFEETHGRRAVDIPELDRWVATLDYEKPVDPRREIMEAVRTDAKLIEWIRRMGHERRSAHLASNARP